MNEEQLKSLVLGFADIIVKESDAHALVTKMFLVRFKNLESILKLSLQLAEMQQHDPVSAGQFRQEMNEFLTKAFKESAELDTALNIALSQGESIKDQLSALLRDLGAK